MSKIIAGLNRRVMLLIHHVACGVSGGLAFGAVAYGLDLWGIRTHIEFGLPLNDTQLAAFGAVVFAFMIFDWALRPLVGKPGNF